LLSVRFNRDAFVATQGIGLCESAKENAAPLKPVVIFDGACNLCNGAVDFIVRHDRRSLFLFASHQSAAAQELLRSLGVEGADNKTVYLVYRRTVYIRSTAALMIARLLPLPFSLVSWLMIIPPCIRDRVYEWVAENRYRWFGTRKTCRAFGLEKEMEGREYPVEGA
jgi:predicted DCC family thiol-disulfide oxidoreductase YuxK